MQTPEIILRADGSSRMGLGHLVRSLALAQMLESDFTVTFVAKEAPSFFEKEVLAKGFFYRQVATEREWFNELTTQQVVVLDGYHFGIALQRDIRRAGAKLACIDDLHDQPFEAELIINHAPGVSEADYTALPHTRFALGLGYALLRPSFLQATQISRKVGTVDTLLICFGGADVHNATGAVLAWAVAKEQLKKIIVVTGAAYRHEDDLIPLLAAERVRYYHNVGEEVIVDLMLQASAAVVPSSSILFEIIACGTVPIISYTANNQKFFHDELIRNYNFDSIGDCEPRVDEARLDQALAKTRVNTAMQSFRECISRSRRNHLDAFHQLLEDE